MTIQTVPLDDQYAASRHDELRVLVVGAGVAGLAAAQLLRPHGLHPMLVERRGPDADAGYMVALMPLVDGPIAALGAREDYLARSVDLDYFRFRAHTGRQLRTDALGDVFDRYGDYRGLTRGALLEVLAGDGFFIGTYPVPGALGAFVGGPAQETTGGPAAFAADVRRKLRTAPRGSTRRCGQSPRRTHRSSGRSPTSAPPAGRRAAPSCSATRRPASSRPPASAPAWRWRPPGCSRPACGTRRPRPSALRSPPTRAPSAPGSRPLRTPPGASRDSCSGAAAPWRPRATSP